MARGADDDRRNCDMRRVLSCNVRGNGTVGRDRMTGSAGRRRMAKRIVEATRSRTRRNGCVGGWSSVVQMAERAYGGIPLVRGCVNIRIARQPRESVWRRTSRAGLVTCKT